MTCIVGLKHDENVFIGGDSAGVAGLSLEVRADGKVFRNGDFIMGFTSSFRMGQLLRYHFSPPHHDPSISVYQYMVTTFVDAVRDCLKAGGYAQKKNEEETGGTFLVGYKGELFLIEDDYQVAVPQLGYTAIGCGHELAKGSLFATSGYYRSKPEIRVEMALAAAEQFSAGVCSPFDILML